MENQNESEKIFEQYLDLNGFRGKWTYEPSIAGKSKRPDYLLYHKGQECFFEVKELRDKTNDLTGRREEIKRAGENLNKLMELSRDINPCPTNLREKINEANERFYTLMGLSGHINPYPTSLRAKINEAREKFKEYKDYCCSLVVFNINDISAILDPLFVFSAMLGNLRFTTDFNAVESTTVKGSEKNVFLGGGKMIDCKEKQPWNTTISAIIVLEDKFLDDSKYKMAIKEEVKKQNRPLTGIEKFAIAEIESHHSTYVTRVVVVENPFAQITFPDNLFNGPFDERWRWRKQNGEVERIFAGDKLRELKSPKASGSSNCSS
jgi:hypothetical protein